MDSSAEILIRKITEAEASVSREIEGGKLDFAVDYQNYAFENLKELIGILEKKEISTEEKNTIIEFLTAYRNHMDDQLKVLETEKLKTHDQIKEVRKKHSIARKYTSVKKFT